MRVGEDYNWTLPRVINANKDLYGITEDTSIELKPLLSFNKNSHTMNFSGEKPSDNLVGKMYKIYYTIVDRLGIKYETYQLLNILARDQGQARDSSELIETLVQEDAQVQTLGQNITEGE